MTLDTMNPVLEMETAELTTAPALFEKRTIVELTDSELAEVQGGTTPVCAAAVASSGYCAGAAIVVTAFVGGAIVGYFS